MHRMHALRSFAPLLLIVSAALGLAGCGGDDHEEENPNAEACEHMKQGPPAALTAGADFLITAPKINSDHKRYDVTLVDVPGGKGGYLTFAVAHAGDYIFYSSAPVIMTVKTPAMADVAAESSATGIPECTEVKGRQVHDLAVGTYVLVVAPQSLNQVSLVVEESGHTH